MKKSRIAAAILSGLMLAAALAGCGTKEETAVTDPESGTTQQIENPDVVAVETAYGTLYYQEQWAQFMQTKQMTEGSTVTVYFLAKLGETEYPLFDVTIGESEGTAVGQLTDADGTRRNVYINAEGSLEYPELSEDDQRCLYAMQEDINFIIENLK